MTDTSPSTAKIEEAIDALIRAVLANDPDAGLPPPEHTILAADIDAAMIVDADLDLIIADPVGHLARHPAPQPCRLVDPFPGALRSKIPNTGNAGPLP